jgi:hypothetical protein
MDDSNAVLGGGTAVFSIIFCIAVYIWMAVCLQKIAEKTNTPNGWLAWIPIANVYLMCMIAGKPWWWLLLLFIPLVNIVIIIILWWKVCEVRGKPGWWSLLIIFVPLVDFIMLGVLAFKD